MAESICDKCGRPVKASNDARLFQGIATGNLDVQVLSLPRHLLPENGCEGSPSRAQYLDGQPRDNREGYPYEPMFEGKYRKAYALMTQGLIDWSTTNERVKHLMSAE